MKNLISISIIAFFLFMKIAVAFGQSGSSYVSKINIPTSPEAALLGRFGDIPIGYYTGTADISVPLYNIKVNELNIPLTLNYHSSGIKVDDQATWVGLGWDLSPEGIIVQEVRGVNDENDYGSTCGGNLNYPTFLQRLAFADNVDYLYLVQWGRETASNSCSPNDFVSDPSPPAPYFLHYADPYCAIDDLRRGFNQPDIYTYNFAGNSGKFYIHPTSHKIILLDRKEDIFFEKTNANFIQATTSDGTVYEFGAVETADGGMFQEYTGKAYKLTRILTLTGREITYTYTNNQYTEYSYNVSANLNNFDINSLPINESSTLTNHHKKTLSKITTPEAIVDFNLESRDDINIQTTDNMQRLGSIDVTSKESGKKVKSIAFTYSYFPYTTRLMPGWTNFSPSYTSAQIDAFGKRLKLESVKEIGYDDLGNKVNTKPPYNFQYNLGVTMPSKNSIEKDFYGYYNGDNGNQTLLPELGFFEYFDDPEYKVIHQTLTYPYDGANRYSDNDKSQAYLLKKITYPTGGFTEFAYEPNTFTNQFIPNKQQLAAFTKDYTAIDNSIESISQNIQFKLHRKTKIHFENHIYNGTNNPNNLPVLTALQMETASIKFWKFKYTNGVPTVIPIKTWDMSDVLHATFDQNGGVTWIADIEVPYDPDPDPYFVYHVSVNFPDELANILYLSTAGVTSHFTFYDYSPEEVAESKQCGVRVKSIKNFTQQGSIASNKIIKYYDGKLLNKFRPLTVYNANDLHQSGSVNANWYEYIAFYKKITVLGNGFGLSGGNLIGYGKVEEIEVSETLGENGKKVFHYFNEENLTHQDCPNIQNQMNGLILKEEIFSNSELITEKTFTYKYLPEPPPKYICANIVRLSSGSKVPCWNIYPAPTPYSTIYYDPNSYALIGSEYGYSTYPLISQCKKLDVVSTKEFSNGNFLLNTEKYSYNFLGQVSTISTTNSKGEMLLTKYYYHTDGVGNAFTDEYMVGVHNIATPCKTEKFIGNKLMLRQRIHYAMFPGVSTMLPQYFFEQIESNPELTKMTIDKYDDKGNILQYTPQNNFSTTILWNLKKTLPITKIENAKYDDLLSLPGGLSANFRTLLPNARVTTYEYKHLIGVSFITDPNKQNQTYEYDAFGRLRVIKDNEGNIIKKICYNYYGQLEDCPIDNTRPEWVATGQTRCVPCSENPNYPSNRREREEKDINPQSSTYNNYVWILEAPGTCSSPPDWQTIETKCELNATETNYTGNEILNQKDFNPCSESFGTLRQYIKLNSSNCTPSPNCLGPRYKVIDGVCEEGVWGVVSVVKGIGIWLCSYAYCFSDGSVSDYTMTLESATGCNVICY